MHIVIDGKPLTIPYPCGLKRYAWGLVGALAAIRTPHRITVLSPSPIDLSASGRLSVLVAGGSVPWQVRFPRAVGKIGADIVHVLQQHGPYLLSHPRIVTTVHDLSPTIGYPPFFRDPYFATLGWYTRFVMRKTLPGTAAFIAVSSFTARELASRVGTSAPIIVIPEGVAAAFRTSGPTTRRHYVLALADFSPRKNVSAVLSAFAHIPRKIRAGLTLDLVVSMSAPVAGILRQATALGIRDAVHIHERPDDATLSSLYRGAAVFVYPSLYEGFGLPVIEAMASGAPVVCSGGSAIGEVAGRAAYFVDPRSPEAIGHAITDMLTHPSMRNRYIRMGLRRASRFTWAAAARQTVGVYEQVYDNA